MLSVSLEERRLIKLNEQTSLTHKVVRGSVWLFALNIISRSLNFIKNLVLARILMPKDFGLMGAALLSMSILESFSQTGVTSALVQKKGDVEDYLNTTWLINVTRGISLFLILFLGAPVIARFFHNDQVVPILKTLAFCRLMLSLNSPRFVYVQKYFQFHKQFITEFLSTMADVSVAIIFGIIFRNVWALLLGFISGNITRFILSYIIFPFIPKLKFDIKKAKDLLNFGKWISGSSVLTFLFTHGDDILVGRILGLTALGFYQLAYRISNLPSTEITSLISTVIFPAYSSIQDNKQKLKEAFMNVFKIISLTSIPLTGIIIITSHDFIRVVLGEKWLLMAGSMQVLALWGLIRSLCAASGPLFQGVGKPHIVTKIQIVQTIILFTIIYPLTVKFGIVGTSWAVVIASLIANIPTFYLAGNIIRCSVVEFLKILFFPICAFGVVFCAHLTIKSILSNTINLIQFILQIGIYATLYFVIIYLIDKRFHNFELVKLIKKLITANKKNKSYENCLFSQ